MKRWMIGIAIGVLLLAGCSKSASPSTDPQAETDKRICESAVQVPWNSPLMTSLTRDPQTPIQHKARLVEDRFEAGIHTDTQGPWDELSAMCVDAGY